MEVEGTSLATDNAGRPHILYYADPWDGADGLRYAYLDSEGWRIDTLVESDYTGSSLTLALDNDATIRLAYENRFTKDVMYATHSESDHSIHLPVVLRD